MSVESFHRLLKVVYLESKHNRRIDHLLHVILRIARDKMFDRLIKKEKGKSTYRIGEINRRHHAAVDFMHKGVSVVKLHHDLWEVSSSSREMVKYRIRQLSQHCNCKIQCASCAVCLHMYTCSCVDSAVHSTACKHTHIVHMEESSGPSPQSIPLSEQVAGHIDPVTHALQSSQSEDMLEKLKCDFQGLISQAQLLANGSTSCDMMKAGIAHLKCAVNTMKVMQAACTPTEKILVQAESIAPNKNSEHQPRFYSTKKRKVSQNTHGLSKPALHEMEQCQRTLSCETVRVCGACFQEEEKNNSEFIDWIQCSNCDIWLHITCTGATLLSTSVSTDSEFICTFCVDCE